MDDVVLTTDRPVRPAGIPARPTDDGGLRMRVLAKERVADEVVLLRLAALDGSRLPDWAPGAHVDLVLPTGDVRQYSLCGDRWNSREYQVAVRRETHGRGGSRYVHDHLAVGDQLAVGGPRNHFHLAPATDYVFVAGGIGITPLLPMIDQAERVGAGWRLLYGGRRRSGMPFLEHVARYGDKVVVAASRETGRFDLEAELADLDPGTFVYFCGPSALLEGLAAATSSWAPHRVRTEHFAAPDLPRPARTEPFVVELRRSGSLVTVAADVSVLEAVRAAGARVLSSCGQGTCGTCEIPVLEGVPDHRDSVLTDHDRDTGNCMMSCVSRAQSDRLVLDL